jgi:UTP--glucose-1-phosphate uridylyltransferase
MRAYEKYGKSVVGIKEVTPEQIVKYSSMKTEHIADNHYMISDMIEKPSPGEEFSLFSILGRCVLDPEIFDILRKISIFFLKYRYNVLQENTIRVII